MDRITGSVTGVNGNLVSVRLDGAIRKNEVGYVLVDGKRLKGETIRVGGGVADMQIYEPTNGIKVGDPAEFTGELMSVSLGPGLLTQIYDGLQNPLPELAEKCGFFLERGEYLDPIPDKDWEFTPAVKAGDTVRPGDTVGTVPEGLFTHHIMVPFGLSDEDWTVESVVPKGKYNVRSEIAVIRDAKGAKKSLSMVFTWPVKKPITCYRQRHPRQRQEEPHPEPTPQPPRPPHQPRAKGRQQRRGADYHRHQPRPRVRQRQVLEVEIERDAQRPRHGHPRLRAPTLPRQRPRRERPERGVAQKEPQQQDFRRRQRRQQLLGRRERHPPHRHGKETRRPTRTNRPAGIHTRPL